MEENILLMFFSPVQVDEQGKVRENTIENIGGVPVKTTNESAIRYLAQNAIEISKIFVLVSATVKRNITYKDEDRGKFKSR